ncbi:MAG: hypothetical protein P4L50_12585 [Anaerolineaceae bacterium]|nr:hypothetical protein [Anaerolineaceae bacterium]
MQFILTALGIISILLAFLAQQLGIDNNPVWGTGRILILVFGVSLLLLAILRYLWKTQHIPVRARRQIIKAVKSIHDQLVRTVRILANWQPFSLALSILVVLLVSVYAIWYTSLGRFTVFTPVTNTYVDLGEAFLHGQLSLLQRPDPRLAALSNPYDTNQRKNIPFIWDSSYYKGKFYLYWGPVPAVISSIAEWIFKSRPPDQLVALISYIGIAVIFLLLLLHIRNRYYPDAPGISIPFLILAAVVNLPIFFILGRPQIYETSIIAGQFFLFLGFLFWLRYQITAKYFWLALAGLSWGLAIASRYNLAISVAVFVAFLLFDLYQKSKIQGRFVPGNNSLLHQFTCIDWKAIIAVLIPIALCGIALGIYNFTRFGNPLETGFTYQLTETQPLNHYYSFSYFPSNLYMYLAYPVNTSGSFPFFKSLSAQFNLLPVWASISNGKMFDQVFFGIFPSLPILWSLGLFVPLAVINFIKGRHGKHYYYNEVAAPGPLWRLLAVLLTAGSLQFIFLLVYFYGAMRYILDFYIPFLVLAFTCIWSFDNQIKHKSLLRWLFWLVVMNLSIITAGIGYFAGFDIPPQYFRIINPHLFAALSAFWSSQHSHLVALLGEPVQAIDTIVRISARVVGKLNR